MSGHRKVPLPHGKVPKGWCRWCGGEIRKNDKPNTRANWHPACVAEYRLHAFSASQFNFLIERDGRVCGVKGCGEVHALQVEHRVPLWKVRHLPDAARIKYYGPENLWLNCETCHKRKSKREAAERAHGYRLELARVKAKRKQRRSRPWPKRKFPSRGKIKSAWRR